eukprot:5772351-Alexandrium_andersonii.AAC.1
MRVSCAVAALQPTRRTTGNALRQPTVRGALGLKATPTQAMCPKSPGSKYFFANSCASTMDHASTTETRIAQPTPQKG